MSTWNDLANDSQTAAWELASRDRFRSAVCRAYYAVYSRVTEELTALGVAMPAGRSNPKHGALTNLIAYNLTTVEAPIRGRLVGVVRKLYDLRVIADYIPRIDIAAAEAKIALGLMREAFRCLEDD